MIKSKYHESVMVEEVIESLHIKTGSQVIDGTLGTGGHSLALIEAGASVLGIEMDPKMLAIAKERLQQEAKLVLGNFTDIDKIAKENGFMDVDGIVLDLGVSNLHLTKDSRGFSFNDENQDLDMRLNPSLQGVKAMDLLNVLDKHQLTTMFSKIMKTHDAKNLATAVFNSRPVKTVADLQKIVGSEYLSLRSKKINEMSLPMLALRVAVNSELENLEEVMPKALKLLKKGGRLSVITFHSEEEKIVLKYMNDEFVKGKLKERLPSQKEINRNKRARSAKLFTYVKN